MTNLLLALLFNIVLNPQPSVLNLTQVHKVLGTSVLIRNKIVMVNPDTMETRTGLAGCSGTYIGPNTVLTAAHCFRETSVGLWVRDFAGHSEEARLIKLNPSKDLALLAVVSHHGPHKYAVLTNKTTVGEEMMNVGSPYDLEFLISEGVVSKLGHKCKPFTGIYTITTAMINPGSSGGGAFNKDGELIGVNTMSMGGPFGWNGITMVVDAPTVREFLK